MPFHSEKCNWIDLRMLGRAFGGTGLAPGDFQQGRPKLISLNARAGRRFGSVGDASRSGESRGRRPRLAHRRKMRIQRNTAGMIATVNIAAPTTTDRSRGAVPTATFLPALSASHPHFGQVTPPSTHMRHVFVTGD